MGLCGFTRARLRRQETLGEAPASSEVPYLVNNFTCDECGFVAKTALALANHKAKHRRNQEKLARDMG